jgi:DNA modification methylase
VKHLLYHGDCLEWLGRLEKVKCIFADPPDNIGLGYDKYDDKKPDYELWLWNVLTACCEKADIVWFSFNAKWTFVMGYHFQHWLSQFKDWEGKACVQTFTFGQHNHNDLGNCHRPLWRLMRKGTKLYPNAIRVPSWRQENGDKRADPRGRVPGDVFDFTRVTGNSKQRRTWHPTQLNEGLVERCVKLSTRKGDRVLDPFGGTGTTLRVCDQIGRDCSLIEFDRGYCKQIAKENGLLACSKDIWKRESC